MRLYAGAHGGATVAHGPPNEVSRTRFITPRSVLEETALPMETAFLLSAVGLGLAYAAAPGVVNTETLRRGMAHGFRAGFAVELGALLGDVLWAVLALSGIAALADRGGFAVALGLVGGLFLCRLAFAALREAWAPPVERGPAASAGHFRTGVVFGLANPAGLAFWAGIGGGLLTTRTAPLGLADYAVFVVAFLLGALVWSVGFSAFVGAGRRFARPRVLRAIDAVCGAVLAIFGVRLLWSSGRRLLRMV